MIGEHVLRLSETNRQGYVPMCSCGWLGLAHATRATQRTPNGRRTVQRDESRTAAAIEHAKHVERCAAPAIDRMHP